MLEYAPMLHVSYYAPNYAGIIRQGLPRPHPQGYGVTSPCICRSTEAL